MNEGKKPDFSDEKVSIWKAGEGEADAAEGLTIGEDERIYESLMISHSHPEAKNVKAKILTKQTRDGGFESLVKVNFTYAHSVDRKKFNSLEEYNAFREWSLMAFRVAGLDVDNMTVVGGEEYARRIETVTREPEGIVESLLADRTGINDLDEEGLTALQRAICNGQREVLELLLDRGADVNAPSNQGQSPLHYAALSGDMEITRLLIDHGADINWRDDSQVVPLHYAAGKDSKEVAELFISLGADVKTVDECKVTPLHEAAWHGSCGAAELLIGKGAEINVREFRGWTPLDYAVRLCPPEKQEAMIKLLRRHGGKSGDEL